jgi:hypothetical protein
MAPGSDLRKEDERHLVATGKRRLGSGVAAAVNPGFPAVNEAISFLSSCLSSWSVINADQCLAVCRSWLPREVAGMGAEDQLVI